ncbi:MAG: type II toxin-antitoxin system Phd/YefM family antitoxin [Clostridia bacterium]|nr:MAG: type II toxin-antitoxin system Phd/YefM family antitoxin [Clostridia bacterium]
MIKINPQILTKNGRKEFVVLSYDDFRKIQEELEAYDDLRALRQAKVREQDAPTVSLEQAKSLLGI